MMCNDMRGSVQKARREKTHQIYYSYIIYIYDIYTWEHNRRRATKNIIETSDCLERSIVTFSTNACSFVRISILQCFFFQFSKNVHMCIICQNQLHRQVKHQCYWISDNESKTDITQYRKSSVRVKERERKIKKKIDQYWWETRSIDNIATIEWKKAFWLLLLSMWSIRLFPQGKQCFPGGG